MPEALARSHNDSILSRPSRGPSRHERRGFAQALLRRLLSRPARTIAGAALAAVMTGILVNALVLQKERRVIPLLGAGRPAPEVSRAAAPSPPAVSAAAQPPARPALAVANPAPPLAPPAPPARTEDPIRALLRGDAAKDPDRLVMAAQSALIKLGYPIKADGVVGASTEQAIQRFERSRRLTPSNEITPRLVKLLSAAAR